MRAVVLLLAALPALAGCGGASGEGGAGGGPAFAARQRAAVAAAPGGTAELHCRVRRLRDRVVSWVRSSDLQILTHAGAVFTADARVSCSQGPAGPPGDELLSGEGEAREEEEGEAWGEEEVEEEEGEVSVHTLRIARLRAADAGRYECQVNTEPKMSLFFNLTVVESGMPRVVVWAEGGGVVRGAAGGAARLRCGARYEPPPAPAALAALPPLRLAWRHDGRDLGPQSARGGVSLEAERWAGGAASRLTLAALRASDAGEYRCAAAGRAARLTLLVAPPGDGEEEPVGEMQRDQAVARVAAGAARGGRGGSGGGAAAALVLVVALLAAA